MFNNLEKLLKQFDKKERSAEGKMNVLREGEKEKRPDVSFTPADIAEAKYQTWLEAIALVMSFINDRENEIKDIWTTVTEDSDSYPDSYVPVFAEGKYGEHYGASCDVDFNWSVTDGDKSYPIADELPIVRWCPLDSIKPRDLSWPMELAETLAAEVDAVIDILDCADASEDAEVLAGKVTDTLRMVSTNLYEIKNLIKET